MARHSVLEINKTWTGQSRSTGMKTQISMRLRSGIQQINLCTDGLIWSGAIEKKSFTFDHWIIISSIECKTIIINISARKANAIWLYFVRKAREGRRRGMGWGEGATGANKNYGCLSISFRLVCQTVYLLCYLAGWRDVCELVVPFLAIAQTIYRRSAENTQNQIVIRSHLFFRLLLKKKKKQTIIIKILYMMYRQCLLAYG